MTIPRYPPSFRQDEISLICRSALTGESLCFVGLAGSGKSNIINFLSVDPYGYKPQYLDPTTEPVIFAKINAETWDGSAQNLWEQLWVELANLTADLVDADAVPKIIALSEDVRAFNKLQQQVDLVCGHYQRPVMFILDDFDDALRAGPLSMLEQFNRLRSNHRGRLSYLIFTKKLPHVLGRAHNLETHSKFYDLFKNHVYALKLYNAEEARQMLLHLNALNDNALDRGALLTIETLCGGHGCCACSMMRGCGGNCPPLTRAMAITRAIPICIKSAPAFCMDCIGTSSRWPLPWLKVDKARQTAG